MFQIRSFMARVLVALGTTLAFSLPSSAQEEAPDSRVARLVRDLGARSYSVRSRAVEELELLGSQSREQLEIAARSTNDEVRLAARRLLHKLHDEELWAAGEISLNIKGATTTEIILELAKQSGNLLQGGDQYGPFEDRKLTLALDHVPFWQALDQVCKASGNHVRPPYDVRESGLVVVAGPPRQYPVAWSGPVQAQIVSARRVFIEDLDYEQRRSDISHTLVLNLRMCWEDRFALAAYRTELEFVEAIADDDSQVSAASAAPGDWKSPGKSTHEVALSLRIQPPPAGARSLDVLRVKWGLIAVGDMQTLEARDWAAGRTYTQDDLRLEIVESQASDDGRLKLTLLVNRDLPPPQPREVLYHENSFDLVDAEGLPLRKQVHDWRLTEEGLRIEASFSPEFSTGDAECLRFGYPRLRSQRALEIIFRDVPLPSAKAK